MSIKPIDHNLTYNNTIYQSKDKQNDFNRSKETNAFLQNHEKSQIKRNMKKINDTEHTLGKKITKENNHESSGKKFSRKKKDKEIIKLDSEKVKEEKGKGQKIDLLI